MITRPMLACNQELTELDFETLRYPFLATPKIDGIRCIVVGGKALSRSFKPIPNIYIRNWIERNCPSGFDGEIVCPGGFNATQSIVMTKADLHEPFAYRVFDYVLAHKEYPYERRIADLREWFRLRGDSNGNAGAAAPVYPDLVENSKDLLEFEALCLAVGYEGAILRTPTSPYKCGRSTLKEHFMLKVKRFITSEAIILDWEELQHNDNEAAPDEFGLAKRPSHKENQVPGDTLGALWVKDVKHPEWYFKIGSGFTQSDREYLWENRDRLKGQLVSYKYQPYGMLNAPRIPIFKGLRHRFDMSPE